MLLYESNGGFVHCGLDGSGGYEPGNGGLYLCYEPPGQAGCGPLPAGAPLFPSLRGGRYVVQVGAHSRLGHCARSSQEFTVDATGPVVTNLTSRYQGNNPTITWSARDDGAGLSNRWQAMDIFIQHFDRETATLGPPAYHGTFYPGYGITRDSVKADGPGAGTAYFSVRTHFDMSLYDHVRAVIYGGRDGDWFVTPGSTSDNRQYIAGGGVRDSLNNPASPLEINSTIRFTEPDGPIFVPGPGATARCVATNAGFGWDAPEASEPATLTITYRNAVSGEVLATRHFSNVTWVGNRVADQPNLDLDGVATLEVGFSILIAGPPEGASTLFTNLEVDRQGPVVTNLSPALQGRNPTIAFSVFDGCGGVSEHYQVVDLFSRAYDTTSAALQPPLFQGTYSLRAGIERDSVVIAGVGFETHIYSLRTHLNLNAFDHLDAVVYGGAPGDRVPDWQASNGFHYQSLGGVRDSIGNPSAPLTISTSVSPALSPIAISGLEAECMGGEVRLRRHTYGIGSVATVTVQRATGGVSEAQRDYRDVSPEFRAAAGESGMNFTDPDIDLGRVYYYRLRLIQDGIVSFAGPIRVLTPAPELRLFTGAPNPMRGTGTVQFEIPRREPVSLSLYTVTGRLARVLVDQVLDPGVHTVGFDSRGLGAGSYYVRLEAGGSRRTRPIIILD